MKKLFVLAGGLGTRLRSLVSDVPKPLAPVAGRPFLMHLIDNWVAQGVKEFVFLLHYESAQIRQLLTNISDYPEFSDIKFIWIVEDVPLGTGGSILNAIKKLEIKESFLIANADTWLQSGIAALSKEAPNIIASVGVPNCQRYGALTFDGDNVTDFIEKSSVQGRGYVSSGLYHLDPNIFDSFEVGSCFSLEDDVFPGLVLSRQLRSIKLIAEFIDIGVPEDYLNFCNWMELRKKDDF